MPIRRQRIFNQTTASPWRASIRRSDDAPTHGTSTSRSTPPTLPMPRHCLDRRLARDEQDDATARTWLEMARPLVPGDYHVLQASLATRDSRSGEAADHLETALSAGDVSRAFLRRAPEFDVLRPEPNVRPSEKSKRRLELRQHMAGHPSPCVLVCAAQRVGHLSLSTCRLRQPCVVVWRGPSPPRCPRLPCTDLAKTTNLSPFW